MRNLRQLFDWQYIGQIIVGDFAKFCGLLRIYELYLMESAFFVTGIMGTKFLRWMVNVAKSSLSPLFVARALQGEGSKIGVSTYLYLTY